MNRVALDTNILLRLGEPDHPSHGLISDAVKRLGRSSRRGVLLPQTIYEFWAVATRTKAANGLGMTVEETDGLIDGFTKQFPLKLDERGIFTNWRTLARQYRITGVNSHDTRIVAAMLRHGISTLLTTNARDFSKYAEIKVLTPGVVLAGTADE